MRIAAIIPALDQHELTRRCVDSLLATTPAGCDLGIVLVDDGSTPPYAAGDCAVATIVRYDTTRGYTQAVNLGIATALETQRPDAVLLLNNDVEFSGEALADHLRGLERFDLAGGIGRLEPHREDQPAPFVEFSCVLIRAAVFAQAGLLDPRFVSGYYSDDDFCLRCQIAGFRIGQLAHREPPAVRHHIGSTHGPARRERIRAAYPIFVEKWSGSAHPAAQRYLRHFLWNPNLRIYGTPPGGPG